MGKKENMASSRRKVESYILRSRGSYPPLASRSGRARIASQVHKGLMKLREEGLIEG